jgi:hypothetical protein
MSRKAFAASDAEWAYHGGEFVKLGDVRLSPATHALNYGTGVFEGIRAYWNPTKGTLQVLSSVNTTSGSRSRARCCSSTCRIAWTSCAT